jgi:hypothetical protein
MICPKCRNDDPQNREMCPDCGYPVKPIPVPPGGKIRFGEYDWYVLYKQDGKMLIITERIIEKRPYHHEETSVTWETCDLRKYLNGEFYYSFNAADRARIIEVTNDNPDNPWYGTRGGNPTVDKIFLLSIDEVLMYFGDSGQIKTRYMYPSPWGDWCKDEFLPWIDDEYNVNRRAMDDDDVCSNYWLRSPGSNERVTTNIMGFCGDGYDQGGINFMGHLALDGGHFIPESSGTDSLSQHGGVRPAMWIKEKL